METTSKNYGTIEPQAQRRLQNVLNKAQAVGFKAMRKLADRCMAEGRYGYAGSIYEGLGKNRKAANAYLKGEEIEEVKRMIDEGKLILIKGRAEKAFEIASRQGDWQAAEEWAKVIVERRIFDLRGHETSGEAEKMVAEARSRYARC